MDLSRFSACTYPIRERSPEEAFRVIAAAGITKVDLWGRMPQFSPDPAVCDPDALLAAAARAGVRIANLGTYPGAGFGSEDPAEQEADMGEMVATIERAAYLGARSIRVRPGETDDVALIERLVPWFRRSAEVAQRHGVTMGMENHAGSLAGIPEACAELCERVGSPYFGVLYEPSNLLAGGVDYKDAFARLRSHVVHVHLKDGRWVNGRFQGTHLGEGQVDARWVLESLDGVGYPGDIALEYEICELEPIETGLRRWVEFVRRL